MLISLIFVLHHFTHFMTALPILLYHSEPSYLHRIHTYMSICYNHVTNTMWLLHATLLASCDRLEDECAQSVVRELPCKVSKLSQTSCDPNIWHHVIHLVQAGCVCSGCASEGRDVLPLHREQKGPLCSGARTTGGNIQEATQYVTCYVCTIRHDWKAICFLSVRIFSSCVVVI